MSPISLVPLLLLGGSALSTAIDGLRTASSPAGAFNADWPGHARHHTIVNGFTQAGVAALCLALVAAAAAVGEPGPLRPAVALLLAIDGVTLSAGRLPRVAAEGRVGASGRAALRCAAVVVGGLWAAVAS